MRRRFLDNAEQPQDKDQDQKAAKTDIHDIPPMFVVEGETVLTLPPFQSLRCRDAFEVLFYPPKKAVFS